VYPAIQHTVFDRLKAWYLKRYNVETLPSRVAFCLGICATMTALCKLSLLWMFSVKTEFFSVLGFTYPLIYLKVCVQAQKEAPLLSTVAMAKKIISQNGVLGLWQGL
jgi:hypothetical protein